IAEADVQASAAIDFAHYYAEQSRELESVENALLVPSRLTVVVPAAPTALSGLAGAILGALAAGSAVIGTPAPHAPRAAAVSAGALWGGRLGRVPLAVAVSRGRELVETLVGPPDGVRVLLGGDTELAGRFRAAKADVPLLADLDGSNWSSVTSSADVDI